MKTNQIMKRPMGEFVVEQRTIDSMFNATYLLEQWNKAHPDKKRSLDNFWKYPLCIGFIQKIPFLKDKAKDSTGNDDFVNWDLFVPFCDYLSQNLWIDAVCLATEGWPTLEERHEQMDKYYGSYGWVAELLRSFPSGYETSEPKETLTYIMTDKSGYYKIGKTKLLKERYKTLKVGNPTLKLIGYIVDNVESKLHNAYANKNISGEWFALSEADIRNIKESYGERWRPELLG